MESIYAYCYFTHKNLDYREKIERIIKSEIYSKVRYLYLLMFLTLDDEFFRLLKQYDPNGDKIIIRFVSGSNIQYQEVFNLIQQDSIELSKDKKRENYILFYSFDDNGVSFDNNTLNYLRDGYQICSWGYPKTNSFAANSKYLSSLDKLINTKKYNTWSFSNSTYNSSKSYIFYDLLEGKSYDKNAELNPLRAILNDYVLITREIEQNDVIDPKVNDVHNKKFIEVFNMIESYVENQKYSDGMDTAMTFLKYIFDDIRTSAEVFNDIMFHFPKFLNSVYICSVVSKPSFSSEIIKNFAALTRLNHNFYRGYIANQKLYTDNFKKYNNLFIDSLNEYKQSDDYHIVITSNSFPLRNKFIDIELLLSKLVKKCTFGYNIIPHKKNTIVGCCKNIPEGSIILDVENGEYEEEKNIGEIWTYGSEERYNYLYDKLDVAVKKIHLGYVDSYDILEHLPECEKKNDIVNVEENFGSERDQILEESKIVINRVTEVERILYLLCNRCFIISTVSVHNELDKYMIIVNEEQLDETITKYLSDDQLRLDMVIKFYNSFKLVKPKITYKIIVPKDIIIAVEYGNMDVRNKFIIAFFYKHTISIPHTANFNDIFGDPLPGEEKELSLYLCDGTSEITFLLPEKRNELFLLKIKDT